jgi:protein O-GlcNAc transferase
MSPQELLKLALGKVQAGQFAEAEVDYRLLTEKCPDYPEGHNDLGNLLCVLGRASEAVPSYHRAITARPRYADAYTNLGNAHRLLGQLDEAIAAHQQAISLSPENAAAFYNLGVVFQEKRLFDQAINCYRRALEIKPNNRNAIYNLACALESTGRLAAAIAALEHLVKIDPGHARAHANLGGLLLSGDRIDEALALCRRAIDLDPNLAEAHGNLGNALWQAGRADLAMAHYRHAAELAPGKSAFLSNCSYVSYFVPGYDPAERRRTHAIWNKRFTEPLARLIRPATNGRSADRRLRVGYVSPNFCSHPQAAFILPLLEHHDRKQVEIFCYADVNIPDAVTRRMRAAVEQWRDISRMDEAALAERVREDGIDILVDTTMHMNRSRLLAFARKPAPIQAAYLAYPGTTGLPAMDYRLTDVFIDPPGEFDDCYTEESIRLPRTFACYDPAGFGATEETEASRTGASAVMFGCLNNFAKVNRGVIELWSGVLKAVGDSRLCLLASSTEGRRHVLGQFAQHGIDPGRVEFIPKQNRPVYMNEYRRIDICLDTLPYCGHTTSLDALWMGVPVVTRVGQSAAGRVGWSLMNNLRLSELAARDDGEFVRIAAELAADRPRLGELQRTMRQRLLDSPIMDGAGFARDLEAAYRQMWHIWVGSR